jgi:hypothetical protein
MSDCAAFQAAVNLSTRHRVLAVRRFAMNPLLMVYFSAGTPFAGLGLLRLQARLERWAYDRHVED